MSQARAVDEPKSRRRDLPLVGLAVVLLLVAWAEKPLAIDDPLFVWTADHIRQEPADFYGFEANWYGTSEPMYQITENPPAMAYYLAAASVLLGTSENARHVACWLPAIAAACGCYVLASRVCTRPLLAALVCVCTPAFVVSATTLMCDVAMLALWIWAVVFWVQGCDEDRIGALFVAAALVSAATLTKYFAVSLIPLLGLYAALRRVNFAWVLAALAVPIAVLFAYDILTRRLYGTGLFSEAVAYAAGWSGRERSLPQQTVAALTMVGGCLPVALLLAPRLWPAWVTAASMPCFAMLCVVFWAWPSLVWSDETPLEAWSLAAHAAVFAVAGIMALGLVSTTPKRDAVDVLLGVWVLGVFAFAGFVNWTINARGVLPMAPALAILIVRRLERRGTADGWPTWGAVALAAFLASAVAWADFRQARAVQFDSARIWKRFGSPGTLWYQGHWGFQYYLDRLGARHTDTEGVLLSAGDRLVVPVNNTNIEPAPLTDTALGVGSHLAFSKSVPVSTMRMNAASFYGEYGPLPYALANLGPESYYVFPVLRPFEFKARSASDR